MMPDLVETSAQLLSIPSMRLISGANHDAGHLATVCPLTTMIFIPCKGGVSHNEAEHAQDEDLVSGARVLCQTAFGLAQS
jgi:N-carbamoyl-L-amino-acid hydrolase